MYTAPARHTPRPPESRDYSEVRRVLIIRVRRVWVVASAVPRPRLGAVGIAAAVGAAAGGGARARAPLQTQRRGWGHERGAFRPDEGRGMPTGFWDSGTARLRKHLRACKPRQRASGMRPLQRGADGHSIGT